MTPLPGIEAVAVAALSHLPHPYPEHAEFEVEWRAGRVVVAVGVVSPNGAVSVTGAIALRGYRRTPRSVVQGARDALAQVPSSESAPPVGRDEDGGGRCESPPAELPSDDARDMYASPDPAALAAAARAGARRAVAS